MFVGSPYLRRVLPKVEVSKVVDGLQCFRVLKINLLGMPDYQESVLLDVSVKGIEVDTWYATKRRAVWTFW